MVGVHVTPAAVMGPRETLLPLHLSPADPGLMFLGLPLGVSPP